MAKKNELEALFRATCYRVFLPGGHCDLRIGKESEVLRDWLETSGHACFSILTAYNPGAVEVDAASNAERQAQLECELLEGNYEPYAGENVADDDAWPTEESCFVPDLVPEDACALAEDFGQCAVVCGGSDGVPHLVWIESSGE
ncbi:MAG: DUF3293 domain-containing protein [Rhodocyclales bacterium GT-UBC]|nr:MAG: DUF3293 domain-containing protein [Rhodocyclales bacterium GT-UBC]